MQFVTAHGPDGPDQIRSYSGCNFLREARTKAQESYLAGVIYSTCRVDLNRYPRVGRYSQDTIVHQKLGFCQLNNRDLLFLLLLQPLKNSRATTCEHDIQNLVIILHIEKK